MVIFAQQYKCKDGKFYVVCILPQENIHPWNIKWKGRHCGNWRKGRLHRGIRLSRGQNFSPQSMC